MAGYTNNYSGGGGAPAGTTPYIVVSAVAGLASERILTGTANQITLTDAGAGSTLTLSLPQSIAAASAVTFGGLTINGTTSLDGAVTINDSSADVDFRVESNGMAYAFGVDGGNDNVGFGAAATAGVFIDITELQRGSGSATGIRFTAGGHTLDASTEYSTLHLNTDAITTWAQGAIARQAMVKIEAPTYRFNTGSSTITNVCVHFVEAAPTASTNAVFTNTSIFLLGGGATIGPTTAGMTYSILNMPDHTITVTGSTQVTSASMASGVRLGQITLTDASAVTIDAAATLYIAGPPIAAGSVTLSAAYSAHVDTGNVRIDDALIIGDTALVGTEKLLVDSGAGVTVAYFQSAASNTSAPQSSANICVWQTTATANNLASLAFIEANGAIGAALTAKIITHSATVPVVDLLFYTRNGASITEKARVTAAGALLVNATAVTGTELFNVNGAVIHGDLNTNLVVQAGATGNAAAFYSSASHTTNITSSAYISVLQTTATANNFFSILFSNANLTTVAAIAVKHIVHSATVPVADMLFYTRNGATNTEKMRLDSYGNLMIGVTAPGTNTPTNVFITTTGTAPTSSPDNTITIYSTDLSAGNTMLSWYTEGTSVSATTLTTPNQTIAVRVNGTVYYVQAKLTND